MFAMMLLLLICEFEFDTWCKLDAPPYAHWHHSVVDHMQCGNMSELFAKYKKNGVHEFQIFGHIVPPRDASHLKLRLVFFQLNQFVLSHDRLIDC